MAGRKKVNSYELPLLFKLDEDKELCFWKGKVDVDHSLGIPNGVIKLSTGPIKKPTKKEEVITSTSSPRGTPFNTARIRLGRSFYEHRSFGYQTLNELGFVVEKTKFYHKTNPDNKIRLTNRNLIIMVKQILLKDE